ncbi:hypothetical protein ES703_06362 [subsurface metagenome]
MEHFELRCLCDYTGGAQAVNTWQRPTPAAVFGELQADERAEIVYAEIWSPVTVPGVEEELRKVVIIADGEELGRYVSLSGIRATVMAPPKDRIWAGRLYSFGTPMSNNPLLNTTIKVKQNVTVACLCGPTVAITMAYRVRLWGYIYKNSELPRVFGTMQFPAALKDNARNRILTLSKSPIPVNKDSWLTLPGGKDQSIPKINPFARYAYNLLATDTRAGDYQFRFETGGVAETDENMFWEFDEKEALLIEGLGVKAAGTLARTGLWIAGDYHPKGPTTLRSLFPTTVGINELNFGHLAPFAPVAHPYYAAIPKLARPYLIWNEIGGPVIRDDGTAAVGANAVLLALTGIRLEMRA